MPAVNVTRIQLYNGAAWGTAYDFDEMEINAAQIYTVNNLFTLETNDAYPTLYDPTKVSAAASNREHWRLDLDIFHEYLSTLTKVRAVIANNYKVRVYYRYLEVAGTYMDMILDPNYMEIITYGRRAARYETQLHFFGRVA
jgi:hypothetical protein